jgi:hypothetical protein
LQEAFFDRRHAFWAHYDIVKRAIHSLLVITVIALLEKAPLLYAVKLVVNSMATSEMGMVLLIVVFAS